MARRIAIIGTGATAVQLIPELTKKAADLTVYQRTPIWCFPKPDWPLPLPLRLAVPPLHALPPCPWVSFLSYHTKKRKARGTLGEKRTLPRRQTPKSRPDRGQAGTEGSCVSRCCRYSGRSPGPRPRPGDPGRRPDVGRRARRSRDRPPRWAARSTRPRPSSTKAAARRTRRACAPFA